jgi:hypothetical protein
MLNDELYAKVEKASVEVRTVPSKASPENKFVFLGVLGRQN